MSYIKELLEGAWIAPKQGERECEFCGSANVEEKSGEIESDEAVYWIECNSCMKESSL